VFAHPQKKKKKKKGTGLRNILSMLLAFNMGIRVIALERQN
jgi:hypothetical protein